MFPLNWDSFSVLFQVFLDFLGVFCCYCGFLFSVFVIFAYLFLFLIYY